jgi:uncharacterized protein (DUF305 family)
MSRETRLVSFRTLLALAVLCSLLLGAVVPAAAQSGGNGDTGVSGRDPQVRPFAWIMRDLIKLNANEIYMTRVCQQVAQHAELAQFCAQMEQEHIQMGAQVSQHLTTWTGQRYTPSMSAATRRAMRQMGLDLMMGYATGSLPVTGAPGGSGNTNANGNANSNFNSNANGNINSSANSAGGTGTGSNGNANGNLNSNANSNTNSAAGSGTGSNMNGNANSNANGNGSFGTGTNSNANGSFGTGATGAQGNLSATDREILLLQNLIFAHQKLVSTTELCLSQAATITGLAQDCQTANAAGMMHLQTLQGFAEQWYGGGMGGGIGNTNGNTNGNLNGNGNTNANTNSTFNGNGNTNSNSNGNGYTSP